MRLPSTQERVGRHTADEVNQRIRDRIDRSIEYHRNHQEQIDQRLRELDREWDIERALQANAASLVVGSSVLGFVVSRRFFAMPLIIGGFLLQHALEGWCPPLPVLRRLGFRTSAEIQEERRALEAIRPGYH